MQHELESMRQAMVIRGYAQRSVDIYLTYLKRYLEFEKKPIAEVTDADVRVWQYHLVHEKKVSWTLFNQAVSALHFYFQKVRLCSWPIKHIPFHRVKKNSHPF